jgi:flavin reductase (DIM6/NTAB) family NADH-FMN oxidoreductase RutF
LSTADPTTVSLRASELDAREMYLLLRDSILPRPIAWVSTVSAVGGTNLAPFSFFTICSPSPPVLGFSCGPRGDNHNDPNRTLKDTERNLRELGEFVVNLAPERLLDEVVRSAEDLPHGQSEFAHIGLASVSSAVVRPPRLAATPVAFECHLLDIHELGTNSWIMGTVVHIHIDRSVYVGAKEQTRHRVDLLAQTDTRPVGRLGRAHYVRLRDLETRMRT